MGNMQKGKRNPAKIKARDTRLKKLHKTHTLRQIAAKEGISAERVRQVLKKLGISYKGSPRAKIAKQKTKQKQKALEDKRDAFTLRIYGSTRKEINKLPKDKIAKLKIMYRQLKRYAKNNGQACKININQYWFIWAKSRKFNKKGTGRHSYTIGRLDPSKAITMANLAVQTRHEFSVRNGIYARSLDK